MNKEYLNFFLNEQIQINLITFVEGLILAGFLSFIIQITYLKFSTSLSNKFDFSKNFIILGITTALVITIVKSSLALSLGLVGALSIVRFRAAIKEPEELIYLFLIIATGLGCGAGQLKITLIGILFAILIIIIFSLYWKKKKIADEEILNSSIIFNKRISDKEIDEVINKINPMCLQIKFISLSSTENQTTLNLDLKPKNFKNVGEITETVKKFDSKVKIMLAKKSMLSL
jgi:uncharacterized membrane protein YhiD involved in acid resistance|tara:strand:- start:24 stop:716 length:693 start_codon:yes stop_codon:yes gene_type:complete